MENGSHGVGTPGTEKPGTPGTPGTPGLGPASPRSPSHNTFAGTSHTLHVYTDSDINLDPFADTGSVHSGSSSHIIPIAYVPPSSASMSLADGHRQSTQPSLNSNGLFPPSRPFRSPELNLRLEPPKSAASRLSGGGSDLRPPRFSSPYAASQRSGASRASTISSVGSFVYGDTPVVVSQAQGGVRQVLGVARPEVVQVPAGGLTTPTTPGSGTGADLMRSWSTRSKKNGTTPPVPALPTTSTERSPFSPDSEVGGDPFADLDGPGATGSVRSMNTFGKPGIPGANLRASKSPTQTPVANTFLSEPIGYDSRPSSINTVAGASLESAQRVMLGGTASASTEDLNARAAPPPPNRTSRTSVADSILSGFPFVPPSPIAQGGESNQFRPGSLAMSISESVADPPNHSHATAGAVPTLSELAREEEVALAEYGQAARLPSRHTLGMSTFSATSGVSSSGLEAFPFHFGGTGGAARDSIDTNPDELGSMGPSAGAGAGGKGGAMRASLDTLALSRDLEAFPLPNDVYKR